MRWIELRRVVAAVLLSSALLIGWAAQKGPSITPAAPLRQAPPRPSRVNMKSANLAWPVPEYFVMIDPSHGGDDTGAILAGKLLEKDVTLWWARDLKRQLEDRGIPVRLLRESDQTISLDRRAELTNQARPLLYVALHAGPPARGVRVYAPAIPFAQQPAKGPLGLWETAQATSLDRSRLAARTVALELRKQGRQARAWTTPLRPLNNLVPPAIAVEFAPGLKLLEFQKQQYALASAIATSIAQAYGHTGARQ